MADRNFEVIKLLGVWAPAKPADDSNAEATDTSEDLDDVQIVRVSRMEHAGNVYLVEKSTGLVYTNDLDDLQVVGRWSEDEGLVLAKDGEPPREE
jgi:hypothetical protein